MAGSTVLNLSSGSARYRLLLVLLAAAFYIPSVPALNFIAGGPCQSVCSDEVAGTVFEDVSCLDDEYNVVPALHLKQCVSCQLNSTAVDSATNATDVQWGLFNLRYVLSNCMFGYPQQPVSISSPCQVSCAPLQQAVTYGLPDSTSNSTTFTSGLGFCNGGQFDDTTINNCAFCYSFVPQQFILGNFLQSIHIACHSPPTAGRAFYPDGITIFNESRIAGPTGATAAPVSNKLTGYRLILAIIVPLVCGLFVLAGTCFCCWHFTKNRRARMAASGRMSRVHDGVAQDYSPMTPRTVQTQRYAWTEPDRELESFDVTTKMADVTAREVSISRQSPGLAQGRWSRHTNDETTTPLGAPNRLSYVRVEDSSTVAGALKDPNLHDQYIGGSPQIGVFRAQDGIVDDNPHDR